MGLLVSWAIVSRARTYARLLSDAHFRTISQRVPALRREALARIVHEERDAIRDANDSRVLRTEHGLAIVYTVSKLEEKFVHHCSVSFPEQHVAQGSRDLFMHFMVLRLGLPLKELHSGGGFSAVRHAECVLSPEAHAALTAQPLPDLSDSELLAMRKQAMQARSAALT